MIPHTYFNYASIYVTAYLDRPSLRQYLTILCQQLLLREEEDAEYLHKLQQKEEWQGERFHLFKSRGQHLLTNPRVLDSIVRRAKILPTDTVLEIGPGTGNLTVRLLKLAGKVIAVEIDERMVDALHNRVSKLGLEDKLVVSLLPFVYSFEMNINHI